MKLSQLNSQTNAQVFKSYLANLRTLVEGKSSKVLTEGKRVIVTTEIVDDEDEVSIKKESRDAFIQKAQEIGNFDNQSWVKQLLNGMKQVGVQGLNEITESERPVTNKEIKDLISLLVELIGGNR